MAYIIDLKTFTDKRGNLTVIEKTIPFNLQRIFYIYGVDNPQEEDTGIKRCIRRQFAYRAPAIFIVMMGT